MAEDPQFVCPNRAWRFEFAMLGYNLKMTDIAASIGNAQLKRKDEILRKRRENAKALCQELSMLEGVYVPDWNPNASWFVFPISMRSPEEKEKAMNHLLRKGIETRNFLGGDISKSESLQGKTIEKNEIGKATMISENSFTVGCHPGVTSQGISRIIDAMKETARSNYLTSGEVFCCAN